MNAFLKPDEEREPRHSLQSNISSEADGDWEFVPSPGLLPTDHAIGSSKQQMLPVEILQRAGDWIQWGLDGAVKGVERTCDGINGLWHYRRVSEERRDALELASRQQWKLMEIEQQRIKEQERAQQEEMKRKTELEDQMRVVQRVKKQRDEADARLREQESLLKQAAKIGKDQSQELERLRIEAEQRKFQEAAALSALDELRERQHLAQEESREKARLLKEREQELHRQQEQHQKELQALEEKLEKMKEAMESQANSSANRRSWRNSYGSEEGNEDNFPDEFYCSITLEVMREPVLAADGFSYEKAAIEDWFAKGHRTSPKTGAQMKNTELQPNLALRNLIQGKIKQRVAAEQ
ncbi:hypothetical protein GUITHDRAFT_151687 [Guillardia theta CCMP2712]|uniref:U-box domain-containing protein n=1 Tax=Guillardia theta (strain CCMP2712) TaxID=905079 RepID=L1JKY5_GUITC|nr:hypothetical protein GUITHDRAFT_151687 [Guillardia theta CCMP2712]EKX48789.1 hypothetical protein GUITHDRAFT_151687 [Guillardia theta CCMP2712]|mmetsp:Transcript_28304/g.91602  ORF Transcript_28304/g.91602 Transcript_28304/m.91602 type:complete len:353 (-) Transcript_28304:86-1144(-)|eukprot:XP_005835769.1 hypothetical protein GUITHDRAFT_151687 [Guillardia theta CCMP2712]